MRVAQIVETVTVDHIMLVIDIPINLGSWMAIRMTAKPMSDMASFRSTAGCLQPQGSADKTTDLRETIMITKR